jgi:hypothetical protein
VRAPSTGNSLLHPAKKGCAAQPERVAQIDPVANLRQLFILLRFKMQELRLYAFKK